MLFRFKSEYELQIKQLMDSKKAEKIGIFAHFYDQVTCDMCWSHVKLTMKIQIKAFSIIAYDS